MKNFEALQMIDKSNILGPSTEYNTIMDSAIKAGLKKEDTPAKLISILPELYLDEMFLQDAGTKINVFKSSVKVSVESLVTGNRKNFDDLKIRRPYPNKRYLVAGILLDRKFSKSISFTPDEDEGMDYLELSQKQGDGWYEISRSIHSTISSIDGNMFLQSTGVDETYKYSLENYQKEISNNNFGFRFDGYKRYLSDKYLIYPYKITEEWQLSFKTAGKNEIQSNVFRIVTTEIFLEYKKEYQNGFYNVSDLLAQVAYSRFHTEKFLSTTVLGRNHCSGNQATKIILVEHTYDSEEIEFEDIHEFEVIIVHEPAKVNYEDHKIVNEEGILTLKSRKPLINTLIPIIK